MNKNKVSLTSIAIVFTAVAMIAVPIYANPEWNSGSDSGACDAVWGTRLVTASRPFV